MNIGVYIGRGDTICPSITVGDINSYSATGPTEDGRQKPEFLMERSEASFSNGSSSTGTSNAAAMFAGIVAALKAYNPNLSRGLLLEFVKNKARIPKAPTEEKLRTIPASYLPDYFSDLIGHLEKELRGAPSMGGQYPSGRYALGLPISPLDAFHLLCGEVPAGHQAFQQVGADAEFFVAPNRGNDPVCYGNGYVRCCVRNPSGNVPHYPWDYSGRNEREYLELKKIRRLNGGGLVDGAYTEVPANRVWRTPRPSEIRG
ncbi:MAG: hypothetical protein EB078_10590 [Proteobacteria bacterium]|nr:hypothetical protein [Pseudomonadota bacterium]NDD05344.1 hypothetical protein [Pseudomonadota bacterium]